MYAKLIVLLGLCLLAGCQQTDNTDSQDYFPLQARLRWEYRVTEERPRQTRSYPLSIETLDTTTLNEQSVSVRRTSNGTDYYIRRQEDGLYRVAKRTLPETAPQPDQPPRLILPLPLPQAEGKSWVVNTMPYLLERVFSEGRQSADSLRFPMTYRVVKLHETVEVPAGRFTDCVLVEGMADLSLYADPRLGSITVPITTREWYAPGIGLVRLEREEPLATSVFQGGTLRMELQQFSGD